ncbi:MAG: hypothetical protein N2483_01255 [Burkholderiaceae bacterium]|nr:hypothetical protein [Burkholderiaceae bacterium]
MPGFLVVFQLVWILYFVGVAVLPASSLYAATAVAIVIQLVFALIATIAALAVWIISDERSLAPGFRRTAGEHRSLLTATRLSLALSALGLLALLIDKIIVQGIDYSGGLAAARAQWSVLAAEREHVSSIWSALGYLLSSCFFITVTVLTCCRVESSKTEKAAAWTLCIAFALANSALTGGRSVLLLLAATLAVLLAVRIDLGQPLPKIGAPTQLAATAGIVATGAYTLYIFAERAELNGIDVHGYAAEMLEFLGAEPTPVFQRLSGDTWFGRLAALAALALAYLVHSFFTFAAIVEAPPQEVDLLFGHVTDLAAKVGLGARPDSEWLLTGRFPSLPGALFIKGGIGLVAFTAACLGAAMALSVRLSQRFPTSLAVIAVCWAVQTTAVLSPMLAAIELLNFPFVFAEFFLVAAAVRLGQTFRHAASSCASNCRHC